MIQNISSFFNSSEKVSSLLIKISNQVIERCKHHITDGGKASIWDEETVSIEKRIKECIILNQQYKEVYYHVRNQSMGKENGFNTKFSFSEQAIFGRFDSFCQRLQNILVLLQQKQICTKMFESKLESLLPEELVIKEEKIFHIALKALMTKSYDFLDYKNGQFDKDLEELSFKIAQIKEDIRTKLEFTYDMLWDTLHAFRYIERFESLTKTFPVGDMTVKYERMICAFTKEVDKVVRYFEKTKDSPIVARNYPSVSGKIYWVRGLIEHLKYFMDLFENQDEIKSLRSYRKLVKLFNKVGVIMMKYEVRIEARITFPKIKLVETMISQPIATLSAEHGTLQVNFNSQLYECTQETQKLLKLDIKIPMIMRVLIQKKDLFLKFKEILSTTINEFHYVINLIHPELEKLFSNHIAKLRSSFDPYMDELNWTCRDWEEIISKTNAEILKLKDLFIQANDLYLNRVEATLQDISKVELYELPRDEPWSTHHFLKKVETKCKNAALEINKANKKIENAVEDLIELAKTGNKGMDESSETLDELTIYERQKINIMIATAKDIRKTIFKRVVDKLTNLIRGSTRKLARTFETAKQEGKHPKFYFEQNSSDDSETIFVLDMSLNLPNIDVKPCVEDVQNTLNAAGKEIISVARGVAQWRFLKKKENGPINVNCSETKKEEPLYNPVRKTIPLFHEEQLNFFKVISESKEVTKSLSLLANALSKFSLDMEEFFSVWQKYSDVWMRNKEDFVDELTTRKTNLKDFEQLLHNYKMIKTEVLFEKEARFSGKFKVCAKELKKTIILEIEQWTYLLARKMIEKYNAEMKYIIATATDIDIKLDRPIANLDDIRIVMETQKRLRDIDIDTEFNINTVIEAYRIAEIYDFPLKKEEIEACSFLPEIWTGVLNKSMDLQALLLTVQSHFQRELMESLTVFHEECDSFCGEYNSSGPMQAGLSPREASDRLVIYQDRFDSLWRKLGSYRVGEDLFGLEHTDQPGLNSIKKELCLLQRLYKLYNDVIDSVNVYHRIIWKEINIEEINNELLEFGNRCRKLPKALKEWPAFHALKKIIDDFNDICPLLELMSNKAMKHRHWQRIQTVTSHQFDLNQTNFSLKHILAAPISKHREDIEDICISALKEKDIEVKLKQVTSEWTIQELEFQIFKNRGELLLRGDTAAETVSQADDSLMILGSLMSNRFNGPFKKQIQKLVDDLSNTSEILERWLFVQNLWVYLEAVFVGGDIAKQLPKEAKRFYKIDKTWQKIMARAQENSNVISCCVGDDYLRQTLPHMQEQLELCQRSLTGYLEKKRLIFPRFFFVSDPALLEILGQASDTHTIQSHLLSIFDNVASVAFHEQEYNKITAIESAEGEVVRLQHPVRAEGSVEIWLNSLLEASHDAVHCIIRRAYHAITEPYFDLIEFTEGFQAQVGILGLQILWTKESEEALSNAKYDKKIMAETNNKFLDILNSLIHQTTKDLKLIERRKYETLITVHMHQREIFDTLTRFGIKSTQDFEWNKQSRFYFKLDSEETQISITDVTFHYQNEYLGCQERLVITPLTDRCYITLAQAILMVCLALVFLQ